MRLASLALAATLLAPALTAQPPSRIPQVPTTRVLAIMVSMDRTNPETAKTMPEEVPATVRLYLAGKLDQWYSRTDQPGVVFILNVTTVAEAEKLIEGLPLGVKHLAKFQFIPLGPLGPLNYLMPKDATK